MKCEDFETNMAEALGNELSPEDRRTFEAHLASCASCRREYESLCGTIATLRNLPGPQKVSVRREGSKLVIDESDDSRSLGLPHGERTKLSLFRYAASVLVAFFGGYVFHATQADLTPDQSGPIMSIDVQGQPAPELTASLHGALVRAHVGKPRRPDLAKALIALGGMGR